MNTRTLEEFEIPYFGRLELKHNPEESSVNGEYWIRTNIYGIAGRFSESPEEAKRKGFEELRRHAQERRGEAAKEFNELTSAVIFLSKDNNSDSQSTKSQKKLKK